MGVYVGKNKNREQSAHYLAKKPCEQGGIIIALNKPIICFHVVFLI